MRTVAFCEIDPFCREVLKARFPGVPIYEDIKALTGDRLRADRIFVDLICGGFPCQGVSEAGLRAGLQDARSGLWREYARIIGELRPKFVIVENVSELLRDGYGMGEILGDLAKIGYDAEWHSIPAIALGADHIRERIWIIAYPNSAGCQPVLKRGRKQRAKEMGQDAPAYVADQYRERREGRLLTGAIREDARNISKRLGPILSAAPDFPGLDGAGSPVLGRGEDGIPNRVDRMHALGNSVVPQIPQIIGEAIMKHEQAQAAIERL